MRRAAPILSLLGVLRRALPARPRPALASRVLVAAPGHLGDAILALPTLAAAARRFAAPCFLVNPALAPLIRRLLTAIEPAAEVLPWEPLWFPGARRRSGARFFPPGPALRRRFDVVFDLRGELPSALASLRLRADYRIGLSEFGSELFFDAAAPVRAGAHQSENLAAPLALFDAAIRPERAVYAGLLGGARPAGAGRVVIAPGARCQSKRWPAERFRALARALKAAIPEAPIRLLGGPEDRGLDFPEADEDERGGSSAESVMARLAGARLFIGNDSYLGHLAAALGVPTLVLFSAANDPARWRPRGPAPVAVLHRDPGCGGCRRRTCDHLSCLAAIGVDEALSAARGILLRETDRDSERSAP